MVAGWLKTACWRWKMPPVRPLTISTNLWSPAQVLKLSLQTPEALRWRHSSQGMNQSQQLLSCFLSITPLCSDKVTLLPHQRKALAWLLWRETQKPCGGILGKSTEHFGSLLPRNSIFFWGGGADLFFLHKFHKLPWFFCLNAADDMGLGKTLTMISLILTQKYNKKGEDEKKEKQLDKWLSKTGNCSIISPLFLVKADKGNPTSNPTFWFATQIPLSWLLKQLWSSVPPLWSTTGRERSTDMSGRPNWVCTFIMVPTVRRALERERPTDTLKHVHTSYWMNPVFLKMNPLSNTKLILILLWF